MSDLPIACTLLPNERQQRREQLFERVLGRALEHRPLDDGYAARFEPAPGVVEELARLIELERECCAFLTFRLTVEPGGGPIWLELTGPEGTKTFLESMLDIAG